MTYIHFLWILVIWLTTYLPFLILLGVIVSFVRRKSRKRSFIAVIIAVFLFYHMNRNGQNIENLIESLYEGSFASAFLLIGYLYLIYWWCAFYIEEVGKRKSSIFLKKKTYLLSEPSKKERETKSLQLH